MRADLSSVSHTNTRNIVNVIRFSTEPVFKAEIARATKLSIPTVIRITDDLIAKGLVRAVGKGESSGGKPPQLLEFVGSANTIIGVDLATNFIHAICVDLNGSILSRIEVPTDLDEGPESYLRQLVTAVHMAVEASKVDPDSILGAGIAIPGILDHKSGFVKYAPDFHWENVEILRPLQRQLSMPIILENDSRAKAVGEKWYGLGRGLNDFFCINYGYGIGAAFTLDGSVYCGHSSIAGEFGHTILDRKGPRCDCGNYGCVEALASGQAIARMARQLVFSGAGRQILRLAGKMEAIDAVTVFQAAQDGDPEARDIIETCLDYLGLAIANVITLLDPAVVIIDNYYEKFSDYMLPRLQSSVECYMMKKTGRNTRLLMSQLGDYDGAIGAAAVLFDAWADLGFNRHLLQLN